MTGYAGPLMGVSATGALRARLAAALARQELTGTELARRAEVDKTTVSRLLRGEGGVWPRTARKLALAAGLDPVSAAAPVRCRTCLDMPPRGFTCDSCEAKGAANG